MSRLMLALCVCGVSGSVLAKAPTNSEGSNSVQTQPAVVASPAPETLALAMANDEPTKKDDGKAEGPKKEKPGPKGEAKPLPGPFKLPKEITLSASQEAKLHALVKEFAPEQEKLAEADKEVYTQEQHEKMKAAREEAHAAGKKGKEANEVVAAAIKLSSEQQEKLDKVHAQRKALDERIKAAVLALLTPEQRALAAKGPGGPGRPKGPPEKKPRDK